MAYRVTRAFARLLLSLLFRWEVRGAQNVPTAGPVIICSNHISWWDPVAVGCSVSRTVRFMAKEELFHVPLFGWYLRALRSFPVKRGAPDRKAFRTSLEILERGEVLGLFPEGARGKGLKVRKAEPGAAIIALRTGAPVVPVAVASSYRVGDTLTVKIGEPMVFKTEVCGKSRVGSEVCQRVSTEIMEAIGRLLGGD